MTTTPPPAPDLPNDGLPRGDVSPEEVFVTRGPLAPSIVIGCGGTGIAVVREVKRRVRQFLSTNPGATEDDRDPVELVQFIGLDTVPWRNPPGVERLRQSEYVGMTGFDAARVIHTMELDKEKPPRGRPRRYAEVSEWWDNEIPAGIVHSGARQLRPIGRLALFFNFRAFLAAIENARMRMLKINPIEEAQLAGFEVGRGAVPRNVFIVSSLCGGTGSGTFLDVGVIANHLFPTDRVIAILVMPSVYEELMQSDLQKRRIRANAYAALRELEFFQRGSETSEDTRINYPGMKGVEGLRPFDRVYIIERRNEVGESLSRLDDVHAMIAQHIFLEIGHDLGARLAELDVNVTNETEKAIGARLSYSSFANTGLTLPTPEMVDFVTDEIMEEALRLLLTAPSTSSSRLADALLDNARQPKTLGDPLPEPDEAGEQLYEAVRDYSDQRLGVQKALAEALCISVKTQLKTLDADISRRRDEARVSTADRALEAIQSIAGVPAAILGVRRRGRRPPRRTGEVAQTAIELQQKIRVRDFLETMKPRLDESSEIVERKVQKITELLAMRGKGVAVDPRAQGLRVTSQRFELLTAAVTADHMRYYLAVSGLLPSQTIRGVAIGNGSLDQRSQRTDLLAAVSVKLDKAVATIQRSSSGGLWGLPMAPVSKDRAGWEELRDIARDMVGEKLKSLHLIDVLALVDAETDPGNAFRMAMERCKPFWRYVREEGLDTHNFEPHRLMAANFSGAGQGPSTAAGEPQAQWRAQAWKRLIRDWDDTFPQIDTTDHTTWYAVNVVHGMPAEAIEDLDRFWQDYMTFRGADLAGTALHLFPRERVAHWPYLHPDHGKDVPEPGNADSASEDQDTQSPDDGGFTVISDRGSREPTGDGSPAAATRRSAPNDVDDDDEY